MMPPVRDDAAVKKVVASTLAATRRADWKQFAELMHPEALKELKGFFVTALKAARDDSAELQELLQLFGGAKDVDTLLAMTQEEFFASFMGGITAAMPQLKQVLGSVESEVVGVVFEKDDLAQCRHPSENSIRGLGTDENGCHQSQAEWQGMEATAVG